MLPIMLPLQKRFDPDAIDGALSAVSKLPGVLPLLLMTPIAADGFGTVTVDGLPLSACEQVNAMGFNLLLIPVGEAAKDYDRDYTVRISGFKAQNGLRFPSLRFHIHTEKRRVQDPKYAEHDEQTLIAAREGMVLLRNDGVLPFSPDAVLNCFGTAQHMYRISATGASQINPRWRPTFVQSIDEHSRFAINRELSEFYKKPNAGAPDAELLRRAREKSDTALILLTRHSGEMQDNRAVKGQYYLSEQEEEMIRAVCDTFEKVAVILNTGYPIDMRWTKAYPIRAILYTGFAGMLSGYALMEILDGRTNPSGKLPDTWPWDWHDNPVSKNMPTLDAGVPTLADAAKGVRLYYEEDIYLGYRYFDTFGVPVAFPFGYGLSYTRFDFEAAEVQKREEDVIVRVTVANNGSAAGKEVVQLYCAAPDGRLEKPTHVLIGFEKTALLQPGESQTLTVRADRQSMASFDEAKSAYVMEKGEYALFIGHIGALKKIGGFSLAADETVKTVGHFGCPVEDFKRMTKGDPTVDGSQSGIFALEDRFARTAPRTVYHPAPLPKYKGKTITWPELRNNPTLLDSFVAQMTTDELCMLNVCAGARWAPWQDGAAGSNYALKKYALPSFSVSDANAGLHLKKPNIGFPASSVIAATYNKEIAYTVGRVIAEESRENGIYQNLGPGMNLHRSILNGRHPEYFSEDPLLCGTMAGWHGKGLEENGVACCYKHLFCNNSDLSRKGSHSVVSERALRELYFRAFEIAFEVHKPGTVMTGYNALNGLYPAENAALLQGLLRSEWGFEGHIMSDWDANETIDAVEMVKAGNGWITKGGREWVKVLQRAVKEGRLSRAVLENNVRYQIRMLLKWGGNSKESSDRQPF